MIKILFIPIFSVFFCFEAHSQIFTQTKSARSVYQIEAGYQVGFFESPSVSIQPNHAKIDGIIILFRQYPGLVYISFGNTTSENFTQFQYIVAGLEYPAFLFPNSIGRNEFGMLISGMTDYAKWQRQTDFLLPKFEVSSLGLMATGYYRNVQRQFEFHTRVSAGYGFAYQFFGSENGSELVVRTSVHFVFPELISDYGVSFSGFFNLTDWKFSTSELSAKSQQTSISVGIAF